MKLAITDLYWIAGLLEGEGCFHTSGSGKPVPAISICTTDLDVITKLKRLMRHDGVISSSVDNRHKHYKVRYIIDIYGVRAISWMFTLYPLLGLRRRAKIKEVVAHWKVPIEIYKLERTRKIREFNHGIACGK